jgi:hypothetical protein
VPVATGTTDNLQQPVEVGRKPLLVGGGQRPLHKQGQQQPEHLLDDPLMAAGSALDDVEQVTQQGSERIVVGQRPHRRPAGRIGQGTADVMRPHVRPDGQGGCLR